MLYPMQAGDQYNSWTVIAPAERHRGRQRWLCRCRCGGEKALDYYNLVSGRTKSCRRCSAAVVVATSIRKHGKSRSKVYRAWQSMKTRCYNPNAESSYENHGALGVTVWAGWLKDFDSFYAHIGDPPTPLHTVDRIDAFGNYEPGNVRWATQYEQMQNTRRAYRYRDR